MDCTVFHEELKYCVQEYGNQQVSMMSKEYNIFKAEMYQGTFSNRTNALFCPEKKKKKSDYNKGKEISLAFLNLNFLTWKID